MRINKYLALHKYASRREADKLIEAGRVYINGTKAVLGSIVGENDTVKVKGTMKTHRYYAYNKPRGVITHSPQEGEESIADIVPLEGVFPIGRLDKDSLGLIILTDDGLITDPLLNPKSQHEKRYEVTTNDDLPNNFERRMERGVDIGGYVTKPCQVSIHGERAFSITLTEGKKHQIRRMCGALGAAVKTLKRVQILNIKLGSLKEGAYRPIEGDELKVFLATLGK